MSQFTVAITKVMQLFNKAFRLCIIATACRLQLKTKSSENK